VVVYRAGANDRKGTGPLPCGAHAPDGFQDIDQRRGQHPSRPASPWGAGRLFGHRLGLGFGRRLWARPQQAVEQSRDHRRAEDRQPRGDPNGRRGDPDGPNRQIVHGVQSPVELAPDGVSHAFP
jgi:hypothetical protein